jgi:hypothetical protein
MQSLPLSHDARHSSARQQGLTSLVTRALSGRDPNNLPSNQSGNLRDFFVQMMIFSAEKIILKAT